MSDHLLAGLALAHYVAGEASKTRRTPVIQGAKARKSRAFAALITRLGRERSASRPVSSIDRPLLSSEI
jgi:hypothetical protein